MKHRLVRFLLVTPLFGVAGASVGSQSATACSCPAVADVVAEIASVDVIVSGRTIDFVDVSPSDERVSRHWLVEVDERFRGETADVIAVDIEADVDSCGAPTQLPTVLLLEPTVGQRFRLLDRCAVPSVTDLHAMFEQPRPADGDGPPVAISSVDTADHDLAVVDAEGDVLRYLPGEGRTLGLAACPGGRSFVQLRTTEDDRTTVGSVELVRWRSDPWEIAEVIPVPDSDEYFVTRSVPMSCRNGEGTEVGIMGGAGFEYIGDRFYATTEWSGPPTVLGPGGIALFPVVMSIGGPDGSDLVETFDPIDVSAGFSDHGGLWNESRLLSVRPTGYGWEVTLRSENWTGAEVTVYSVTIDGVVTEFDRAAGVASGPGPTMVIDRAVRDRLVIGESREPAPVFAKTGVRVDAPPPTLPAAADTADLSDAAEQATPAAPGTTSPASTTPVTVTASSGSDDPDDGGGASTIVAAAALAAVGGAGFVLIAVRRRRRQTEA